MVKRFILWYRPISGIGPIFEIGGFLETPGFNYTEVINMCWEMEDKPECDMCGICGRNHDSSEYDFEDYGYEDDVW